MSNKEKVDNYFNEIDKNYRKKIYSDGFPVHFKKEREVPKEKITVLFGLAAQDRLKFVEKTILDGAGWNQIGNAIGWLGFAVFQSYYSGLYNKLFKEKEILLMEPDEPIYENYYSFNPELKKLFKNTYTEKEEFSEKFKNKLKRLNVQFLLKDRNVVEMDLDVDFYMVFNNDFKNIMFYTKMKKDNNIVVLYSKFLKELTIDILNHQDKGYERIDDIYFDRIIINNGVYIESDDEYIIEKKTLEILKDPELGLI